MKLKKKLIVSFLAIGLTPIFIYGAYSIFSTYQTVMTDHDEMLSQMNSSRKRELDSFVSGMTLNVKSMAKRDDIIKSFSGLSKAWSNVKITDFEEKKKEVTQYYKTQFNKLYDEKSGRQFSNYEEIVQKLTPQGLMFQHSYIVKNKNKIGEKNNLDAINDGSDYDQIHSKFQEQARRFVDGNGYYDLFMFNKEGNVVYTYFKETDFSSNMKSGAYKDSGLGKLYQKMAATPDKDKEDVEVMYSDIETYFASYEAPAAFAMTKIKENGHTVGYLAIQIPVPLIDSILTNDGKFEQTGYGKTGESVLVSLTDFKLRSNSRELIGDEKKVAAHVEEIPNFTKEEKNYMKAQNTAALTFSLKNDFIKQIQAGKNPEGEFNDYMGDLSYGKGEIFLFGDQKYALVSRFEKTEILAPFTKNLFIVLGLFASCVVVISIMAWKLATAITTPIIKVSSSIKSFSEGDLVNKVGLTGTDEVAEMAMGFDSTMDQMVGIFNSQKVQWPEIALQKQREIESQKKVQEALASAEMEKAEALQSKKLADLEKEKAEEAMVMAGEAKKKAEELAENEKKAAGELQLKVDQILSVVRSAERGDLSQNLSVSGSDAIGQLANGLRGLFDQLSKDFTQIDQMAKMLANQSETLNEKNISLNDNAQGTSLKSNDMREKTNSVAANIKNLNHSTMEMKQAVNEISKQATESNKYSSEAVKYVSDVKNMGSKLEENSEDIAKFVEVINTIARQTNLLALNATIEAARAGEAGRGFAVVANEVKELARHSGEAANEITQKVSTIKGNTSEIMNSILKVIELMENLNSSSRVVASATEEQYATTEQFLQLITESVREVDEINNGAKVINESAVSTTNIVKENSKISKDLGETSESLTSVVKKFKLKNENGNQSNIKKVA